MSDVALRYNEGKPKLSFVLEFPNALEEWSKVCEYGANKYERGNWKKGRSVIDSLDSLSRHLLAYCNGTDLDEESKCKHMAHILWNAAFILETEARYGKKYDDRDN